MKQQEIQQKVILYQLLQKHLESLKQQALQNESRFLEIQTTRHALNDFGKENADDVLIPLGSGCFADGQMTDTKKVMMEIGSGIVVKKTVEEAKIILNAKEKEAGTFTENIQKEMESVIKQINAIAVEIEQTQRE